MSSVAEEKCEPSLWETYHTLVEPSLYRAVQSSRDHAGSVPIEAILARLPKSDFHCHLNGSISAAILAHMEALLVRQEPAGTSASSAPFFGGITTACQDVLSSAMDGPRAMNKEARMQHCFQVFDNVYKIMTNLAFTRLAVQDMLFASAAENILVTEIRTSLREGMTVKFQTRGDDGREGGHSSKEDYVWTVVSTVEHVLHGGRVSFETGELISLSVWQRDLEVQRAWHATFAAVYGASLAATAGVSLDAAESTASSVEMGASTEACYARLCTALAQMHVRLLVSINRGGKVETAEEAVAIAKRVQQVQVRAFHRWCVSQIQPSQVADSVCLDERLAERVRSTCWVTGMDLSGNCYRGEVRHFLETLSRARCEASSASALCPTSLAITLHAGEKLDEAELSQMVAFRPDRWGHLVFTDPHNLARLLADHGGIELCMTSNLLTGGHEEVREHHLTTLTETWRAVVSPAGASAPPPRVVPHCAPHTLPQGIAQQTSIVALLTGPRASDIYARTAQLRRLRRLARWSPSAAYALEQALKPRENRDGATHLPALPNVSFHTDDRGVFRTSLARELYLAAQHPAVFFHPGMTSVLRRRQRLPPNLSEKDVRDVVRTMWALQRLALLAVFELPWTVWELVLLTLAEAPLAAAGANEKGEGSRRTAPATLPKTLISALAARQRLQQTRFRSSCAVTEPASCVERREKGATPDWKTWSGFVHYCAAVAPPSPCASSSSPLSTAVPIAAAELECVWLGQCFDRYVMAPSASEHVARSPEGAVSAIRSVHEALRSTVVSSL